LVGLKTANEAGKERLLYKKIQLNRHWEYDKIEDNLYITNICYKNMKIYIIYSFLLNITPIFQINI